MSPTLRSAETRAELARLWFLGENETEAIYGRLGVADTAVGWAGRGPALPAQAHPSLRGREFPLPLRDPDGSLRWEFPTLCRANSVPRGVLGGVSAWCLRVVSAGVPRAQTGYSVNYRLENR